MECRPPLAIVGDFHRHIIVLLTLIAFAPIMAVNAFRHSGWERLGSVGAARRAGLAPSAKEIAMSYPGQELGTQRRP